MKLSPSAVVRLRRPALALVLAASLLGAGFLGLGASAQDAQTPAAETEAADTDAAPAPSTEVAAIDPAQIERGFDVWKGQDCTGCHGWAGNGERVGENPQGPSLRATELDDASIKEVVLCGRPGTPMPHHDPQAYTDGRCYGMTEADLEGLQLLTGKPMTEAEADDLVAYMRARMIGRPEQPAKEDCQAYYGARPFCDKYPTLADQGITQ